MRSWIFAFIFDGRRFLSMYVKSVCYIDVLFLSAEGKGLAGGHYNIIIRLYNV